MSDLFYHMKPYTLMGGGLMVLFAGINTAASIGAVFLILMGMTIWKMRH